MRFKKIAAVISAAAVALALAGCSAKEDNGVYVDKDGNISINESKFEDHVNSVFGGGEASSKAPENSEPEEVPIAMTDEIKNAALNSGLVQYNNDIFQRGGYITVADFVEKWKDKYDITYLDGSYEERKDYLLEYSEDIFSYRNSLGATRWSDRNGFSGNKYSLILKDKNNSSQPAIRAYVVNATSPDEKITLDKAIVAEIEPLKKEYRYAIPEWFPMGFADGDGYFNVKFESENNKSYTVKTLCETLEANGIKEKEESDSEFNTYWIITIGGTAVKCYVLGEENLFGAKPLYYFYFGIDSNTDKVKYVSCVLQRFVKE